MNRTKYCAGKGKASARGLGSSNHIETLEARRLLANNLLADFGGIYPVNAVDANGVSYFMADDGVHGKELWKSDGTIAGTSLVRDMTPGANGSDLLRISEVGGKIMFFTRAGDRTSVWVSEGTEATTQKIAEIDAANETIHCAVVTDGTTERIVFTVDHGDNGTLDGGALWASDGTSAGTVMLRDFVQGIRSESIKTPVTNGRAIFESHHNVWSTNGTVAGTIDLTPAIMTAVGHSSSGTPGRLFNFKEHEGLVVFGIEMPEGIIVTDGTPEGTRRAMSLPSSVVWEYNEWGSAGGKLFVVLYHDEGDDVIRTLWSTDLTQAGSAALHGYANTRLGNFVTLGDSIVYATKADSGECEFWTSDGTVQGTQRLAQFSSQASVGGVVSVGGLAFFTLYDPSATGKTTQIWKTNGTAAGTVMIEGDNIPTSIAEADGKLALLENVNGQFVTTRVIDPATLEVAEGPTQAGMSVKDGVLRIHGTRGNDSIRIYHSTSSASRFIVNLNGAKRSFAISSINQIRIFGYSGRDNIAFYDGYGAVSIRSRIWGGGDSDTIYGGGSRDTIYGETGDDSIGAGMNHDLISGGTGDDSIYAASGNDTASGDDGADIVLGGDGVDIIAGGTDDGRDTLDGGFGADVIFGKAVFEIFFGGQEGNDPSGLDEILLG